MSRRVIGYEGRRPVYEDQGPSVARRQGFGGSAMGFYSGTVLRPPRAAPGTVDPIAAAGHRSAAAQRAVERKRAVRARARAG